jgi:hypothetical protein
MTRVNAEPAPASEAARAVDQVTDCYKLVLGPGCGFGDAESAVRDVLNFATVCY